MAWLGTTERYDARKRVASHIDLGSIDLTDVTGLMNHVDGTNTTLITMQDSLNLKSDMRALEALDQATTALTARIASLEARTIVENNRVIFTSVFDAVNMNAPIACHRPRTSCTDPAITLRTPDSLFTVNEPGDYSIAATLRSMNGNASERAIIYLVLRVYAGTSKMLFTDIQFGSSVYYRDLNDTYDSFSLGGSSRLYVSQASVDAGASFEFISIRMDGTDNSGGTIIPNNPTSTIRIEKLVYSLS